MYHIIYIPYATKYICIDNNVLYIRLYTYMYLYTFMYLYIYKLNNYV